MYRFLVHTTIAPTMHFIVANLLHRGGWTFVDGQINLGPVTAWPAPQEPTPSLVATDFVVVKPPDPDLVSCGDAIQIKLNSAIEIEVIAGRLNLGEDEAWTVGAGFDGSAVQLPQTVDFSAANEAFVFTSESTMAIASLDTTTHEVLDGAAAGYLETFVLRGQDASPVLGQGEDPYPICIVQITNVGGPPISGTTFGQGKAINASGVDEDVQALVSFLDASVDELFAEGIPYGGGVPVYPVGKVVLMQRPSLSPAYPRGAFPTLYITARTVAKSVLRLSNDNSEYVVLGNQVAVGPL